MNYSSWSTKCSLSRSCYSIAIFQSRSPIAPSTVLPPCSSSPLITRGPHLAADFLNRSRSPLSFMVRNLHLCPTTVASWSGTFAAACNYPRMPYPTTRLLDWWEAKSSTAIVISSASVLQIITQCLHIGSSWFHQYRTLSDWELLGGYYEEPSAAFWWTGTAKLTAYTCR